MKDDSYVFLPELIGIKIKKKLILFPLASCQQNLYDI